MEKTEIDALSAPLAEWMSKRQPGPGLPEPNRAKQILHQAAATGLIRMLKLKSRPVALFLFMKPKAPRVRGERVLFFEYDPNFRRRALPWIKARIGDIGKSAPKHTRIGISAQDDAALSQEFREADFNTKYE